MTYRNRALLDLCKGRQCIACDVEDGTVVPAHRNVGKGCGLKVSDALVIPLCATCHKEFDSYEWIDSDEQFLLLYADYMSQLFEEGKVQVTGHTQREPAPKKLAKILPRNWPPHAA